ncbi:MAG: 1,4-dihydroxy-2-naphthoate polyprenyltransferase [Ignavibacteriaceae bacterium]|nr:1,4-dihydroxy-2-naphthoate polyprenyltransferase [Ignavibacteriaceae bacterium]
MDNKIESEKIKSWIIASRPRTLPAAIVPVVVGSAAAASNNKFIFLYALIALACSLLIQIGTNFTNDLYDYLKGADNEKRKGPLRVMVNGLITVTEMKAGIVIVFLTAFVLGLYLVYTGGFFVLIIGVASILAGIAYTAGPYPLAYNGLGDLFVFMFFGVVGTVGTYYVQAHNLSYLPFLCSIPVGALITNILVVNNYRDIDEDKAANKYTLAVKFGRSFTRYQFIFLLFISFVMPLILFFGFNFKGWVFLPYLSFPIAFKLTKMIYSYRGKELNKTLELTARLSAIFGLLFSAGILL